jgi:hypothetical protein
MKIRRFQQLGLVIVLWCVGAAVAAAQANVGTGPMTQTLPDTEPTSGVINVGRVRVAPGITVREMGWDSNVFDEGENPKTDYVASVAPDLSMFTRLRFLRVAAYGSGDFRYFKTYARERSVGYLFRGRIDFLVGRLRPFIAGGESTARTRPNGEIDVRAIQREQELSGGLAFDVSRYGQMYVAAHRFRPSYEDAFEEGTDLGDALNRETVEYSAGLRTELTPLTALTLSAGYSEDTFESAPLRNATTRSATASIRMGPEAAVSGTLSVSFKDVLPVDPSIRAFRGLTGRASLTYPFLEMGRFSVTATRNNEYSFAFDEGFYLENTIGLTYTNRLFAGIDAQATSSRSWFSYGFTSRTPPRQDTFTLIGGSLGYNLRNRTRVAINYEYSRRTAPALPERNYDRRRVYLSWMFAY